MIVLDRNDKHRKCSIIFTLCIRVLNVLNTELHNVTVVNIVLKVTVVKVPTTSVNSKVQLY